MYFQTYFYLLVLLVLASLDLTISFRRRLRALHSDGEQLESLRLVRGRARAGHVDDLRRAPGSDQDPYCAEGRIIGAAVRVGGGGGTAIFTIALAALMMWALW